MDMFDKMLVDYSQGSGSAFDEAMKSSSNIEGSLNRLSNTWLETVNNMADSDVIITIINGLNGLLTVVKDLTSALGDFGTISTIAGGILGAKGLGFVNNDTDNGWTTFIDKYKKVPEITEDVKAFFDLYSETPNTEIWNNNDLLKFADNVGGVNDDFKSFLKTADTSGDIMAQYEKHITKASSSTAKFGTTLKSIGANIGIMLAINLVIEAIAHVWDTLNVTVEESQEKLDEVTTKLAELNSEKAKLESKGIDSLTPAEKERLQYLEKRISLSRQLQDIEQKKLYQNQIGTSFTDSFDPDSDRYKIRELGLDVAGSALWNGVLGETDVELVAGYQNALEEVATTEAAIAKKRKEGNGDSFYTKQMESDLSYYNDLIETNEKKLTDRAATYKEKIAEWEESIAKNQEAINAKDRFGNSLLSNSDIKTAQSNIDIYQKHVDTFTKAVSQIDSALYNTPSNLEALKEKLNLSKSELTNAFTSEEISILVNLEFDKEASVEDLRKLLNERQAQADEEPVVISTVQQFLSTPTSTSVDESGNTSTDSVVNDDVDSYQQKLASLEKYLQLLNNGTYTNSNLIDLAQEFGIAGDSVDDLKFQIDELMDSNLEELHTLLEGILNTTDITEGTRKKVENLISTIDKANESAKEFDPLSSLGDMSGKFDKVNEVYKEFQKGGKDNVSADAMLGVVNAFKDIEGIDTDSFVNVLTSAGSTADDVQDAFNSLSTQFIHTSGCLEGLTDETANLVIQFLEEYGIANANTIVMEQLALQKQFAAEQGIELANATSAEIIEFINEGTASDETKEAIARYALEKQIANGITLTTDGDIANIKSLVKSCGGGVEAIGGLAKARQELADALVPKHFSTSPFEAFKNVNDAAAKVKEAEAKAKAEIQAALNGMSGGSASNSSGNSSGGEYTGANYTGANYTGSSGSGKKSGSGGSAQKERDTTKTFDWIERAVNRVTKAFDRLKNISDSVYKTFSKRNSALSQEFDNLNEQISVQQQAYERYMAKANSIGLSTDYVNRIQNGMIDIQDITDETLQGQIDEYQKYYDAAMEASDAVEELRNKLGELASEKFKLISAEFDGKINIIKKQADMLNNYIDITEAKGQLVSAKYYTELAKVEKKNIEQLKKEKSSLQSSLNESVKNGSVKKGSQEWYDMRNSILEVELALQDANKALIDYQKSMRQLSWDKFDMLQDRISNITEEADFLISLMSDDKLFDDNGKINKKGDAVLGLHGVNYNTYMAEADKYAKELKKIQKEIAKNPYDLDLIARREELLQLQRDSIEAANGEKQAIKDLISEGYDAFLNALQKTIDKYKDAMKQAKDLYDYQKNIDSQTDNISSLEKQLIALQGDDSEENKAKVQEIKTNLDKAKDDLAESEYEKYLSDQEQLLDELYSSYEELINQRLDNLDGLVQGVIDSTNENAGAIRKTITNEAKSVGYTLTKEMKSIWNTTGSGIGKVLSDYSAKFGNTMTTVQSTINGIKSSIDALVKHANATAKTNVSNTKKKVSDTTKDDTTKPSKTPSTPTPTAPTPSTPAWGSWFVSKRDSYPKNKLRTETSIVDRLKYRDFDSSMSMRRNYFAAMGGSGTYTGSSSQNTWMIQQMKAHGYKKGSRNIPKDETNWTHEGEIVYRPSDGAMLTSLENGGMVFTKEMSENLWNLANGNLSNNLASNIATPNYNNIVKNGNRDTSVTLDIGDINMYGVNDPQAFAVQLKKTLQSDKGVNNLVKEMTLGSALGNNSLNRYKF